MDEDHHEDEYEDSWDVQDDYDDDYDGLGGMSQLCLEQGIKPWDIDGTEAVRAAFAVYGSYPYFDNGLGIDGRGFTRDDLSRLFDALKPFWEQLKAEGRANSADVEAAHSEFTAYWLDYDEEYDSDDDYDGGCEGEYDDFDFKPLFDALWEQIKKENKENDEFIKAAYNLFRLNLVFEGRRTKKDDDNNDNDYNKICTKDCSNYDDDDDGDYDDDGDSFTRDIDHKESDAEMNQWQVR